MTEVDANTLLKEGVVSPGSWVDGAIEWLDLSECRNMAIYGQVGF
jgi:hypothetical protein